MEFWRRKSEGGKLDVRRKQRPRAQENSDSGNKNAVEWDRNWKSISWSPSGTETG